MKFMNKLIVLVFLFSAMTFSASALDTAKGTIAEQGYGKFYLDDESGTRLHIYESKKSTIYEPNTWRPNTGDKVTVQYTKQMGKNAMKLVASKITLVEAGSMTVNFESPVEVEVMEIGRSKILANVITANQAIRFDKAKGMQFVPTGWIPMPGEKAKLYFFTKPSTFKFGLTYMASKLEKIS